MKKTKITLGILVISFAILIVQSCGNQGEKSNETTEKIHDNSDGHHDMDKTHEHNENEEHSTNSQEISTIKRGDLIGAYLSLKNALVADNEEEANEIAKKMVQSIQNFETNSFSEEQQQQIKEILETSKEHAEHIAKSPIAHQREHFKDLSNDLIDLIAIIGAKTTLYQQYCPMYDNNKGGTWLSSEKEIKNPYFGSKMLNCGKVEKKIN